MAIAATVTLRGLVTGLPSGSTQDFLAQWIIANGVGQVLSPLNLANGSNGITVPSGTTLLLFVPPSGNATSITLKGAAPDTGVALNLTNPTLLALASGVATVILFTGGIINGCEVRFL